MAFELLTDMKPAGGQPEAIEKLSRGFASMKRQTLLGITGSGKTFVMANVIERLGKPTLILAHNKTLAAQLYQEIKALFPNNRVEYFVSYYDYYQPESYIASTDTYIEKDSARNKKIERMRLRATAALMSRSDVIIVSSISCIYGLGNPDDFQAISLPLKKGTRRSRESIILALTDMQYERNDSALETGKFRVRGDVIDVISGYDQDIIRIELDGDCVESIKEVHRFNQSTLGTSTEVRVDPAKYFVLHHDRME